MGSLAAQTQPTTKWYLDPEAMADPEYRATINRAQTRAAALDEAGIRKLVETLLSKEQSPDDHWTLVVLEERAEPALVAALDDARFAELEEKFPDYRDAVRLERVWGYLESRSPASAVAALTKLVAHPSERVRTRAALAVASIGNAAAVAPTRLALHDDEHFVRSAALTGIARAMQSGRAERAFLDALFDDVAAVIDMQSVGGTDAPARLVEMDRHRAAAYLLAPARFRADHPEIGSISRGLAETRVKAPAAQVVGLLDALERRPGSRNVVAYGYALELLALSGDASANDRIEKGLGDPDDLVRDRAANAYLTLHGIPDAYQVAIDRWGGPGGSHSGVPEPILLYAAAHVMNNEVANGSFAQYFSNNYGEESSLAIRALETIGAKRSATAARKAVALFGPKGPSSDQETRQHQLEAIDTSALDRASDAFLKDANRLPVLLAQYAVQHKEDFVRSPADANAPSSLGSRP